MSEIVLANYNVQDTCRDLSYEDSVPIKHPFSLLFETNGK